MKKILVVLLLCALSGCINIPVKRNFPSVPNELLTTCPDLSQTEITNKLSDVIIVVTNNYSKYHECRIIVDAWTNWYTTQKQIFESVK